MTMSRRRFPITRYHSSGPSALARVVTTMGVDVHHSSAPGAQTAGQLDKHVA
jgi:hypothetical protein